MPRLCGGTGRKRQTDYFLQQCGGRRHGNLYEQPESPQKQADNGGTDFVAARLPLCKLRKERQLQPSECGERFEYHRYTVQEGSQQTGMGQTVSADS